MDLNTNPADLKAVRLQPVPDPASGPPLVLLHGVTRNGTDWSTCRVALNGTGPVHALDLRGHGRSPRVANAYRVIDYVADVVAFVRSLDAPAVVLGHSLGGMVAAAVAAEVPDRVRRLVLEDPPFEMMGVRIEESGFLDLFRAYRPLAGSDQPIRELAVELAEAPIRVPGRSKPVRLGDVRDSCSLRFSAACLRQLDPQVLDPILASRWLEGFDVNATLGRVLCPTLLLQADFKSGGALPDDYATELASLLQDGLHVKMTGVGHNIHSTQPEAMLRLVLPFLGSLE